MQSKLDEEVELVDGHGKNSYGKYSNYDGNKLTQQLKDANKVIDIIAEDVKEIQVASSCQPWQALPVTDEDQCERCNPDNYLDNEGNPTDVNAYKKCTEYRCKSLGASCELINQGTEEETCISNFRFDINPPVINPWEQGFTDGLTATEISNGFSK